MKYFIILTLASVALSAKLDKVYLPPNSGSSGGSNAGLETPFETTGPQNFGPSQNFGGAQNFNQGSGGQGSASSQAQILRFDNQMDEQGWHYLYETSDGTKVEQDGRVIPGPAPQEGSLQVAGSYSYVGDDGQTYTVTYTADENGYHAEGAHLPTPPPIPEAILRSLMLTDPARDGGHEQRRPLQPSQQRWRVHACSVTDGEHVQRRPQQTMQRRPWQRRRQYDSKKSSYDADAGY